ncbi:MAG TPA: ABC transporter permease [Pyrinomonadaceae bacterium]|nr:ABC transporter permease [Pyrinomonadaceae bacterium]
MNSLRTFAAIVYNEMLLNSRRIAPYVMFMLCGGNALLWWGWGPATGLGWATNSDFFIAGVLPIYSFMTLPLFTAIVMADPVIRDFRAGVEPLIFSKPVSRAQYLLGKFCGSFFTLVCGQSAFVLTLFVLQWVSKQGMIVQEAKFLPYLKHFLFFVAVSHLVLGAFYFTVGTLTRNAKIVYGLGVAFYPVYISYQVVLLKSLPSSWRTILDPLLMNQRNLHMTSAEVINQLVVVYDANEIINRVVMMLLATICLAILYVRFTATERSGTVEKFSVLKLSTAAEGVYYGESSQALLPDDFETRDYKSTALIAIPEVVRVNEGICAKVNKLIAALRVEFSLLRAERSFVVVMPLAIFCSTLEVAFYNIPADVSQSAAYATNTARLLLLFLIGIAVFYTSEAMHRDREVKIEAVIWSTPVPNSVLLLSKFFATVVVAVSLMIVVGLVAIVIQLMRGHTPVDFTAYLLVYGVVLIPGIIFVTALVVALNALLRNKYLVNVVAVGIGVGLFYFYSAGYNHWLYNPLLYQLWQFQDLASARILAYRLYCLIAAAACLAVAHICFERRSGAARNSSQALH